MAQPEKKRETLGEAGKVKKITASVRLSQQGDTLNSTFFRGTSKSLEVRSMAKQQQ